MTSFSPVHTVGDQLGESLALNHAANPRAIRARVVELLNHVGIPRAEQRLDEYPHQLSGGCASG
jgi:ABC-type microcin C transport system duplicated ATPase subunit YejF